jgi:hypothetical protein
MMYAYMYEYIRFCVPYIRLCVPLRMSMCATRVSACEADLRQCYVMGIRVCCVHVNTHIQAYSTNLETYILAVKFTPKYTSIHI